MNAHADIKEAEHYGQQCGADVHAARAALTSLLSRCAAKPSGSGPRADNRALLGPLNDLWRLIDHSLNVAGLYRNVHPDAGVRAHADRCEQDLQGLITDIGLSRPLYEAVQRLNVSDDDHDTQRWVQHMLRDFKRAGVDRNEAERVAIRALKEELVRIGQDFEKNIRQDVRHMAVAPATLAGLPADYVAQHPAGADGQVLLSTDTPDYVPFMSYARDDSARLTFYTLFRQRGFPANVPVLQAMMRKRHALAKLLGYPSWADYITEDKMVHRAAHAQKFIDNVAQLAAPRAARDYQELLAFRQRTEPNAREVGDWQKAFLEEEVKKQAYALDAQALRPYFAFSRVRDGILATTARLFGVSYRKVDLPVWHPDVEAYEMLQGNEVLGRFYLDLHPRPDKYKHAAMFAVRSGVAGAAVPEAALVCNFAAGDDALMEHDEVQTFFHEFGHLLHHLFAGKQRWVAFSGISTEWDFVEAPSQMLEEWAFDPDTLQSFAKDADGRAIGSDLIAALRRGRDFGRGLWVRHQLFYAALSLALFNHDALASAGEQDADNTDALLAALQAHYSPFAYVQGTHPQHSFGHLDGYSALYYTYMWSLVIAKDLYGAFAAAQDDVKVAKRYRQLILEPGGSRDAADMVRDFLQRDTTPAAFERWMNAD